jgi:DNA-binding transcriptional LysR family regulator
MRSGPGSDLNELQIFAQVAKTQSFTTAAERLALPKSSVSRSIHRLEARLGVRLIERTTRRVALTEEGQIYFDRCERVLEEAEQAEIEIGALQAKPRGTLRVGAPAIFARLVLGPALGEFLAMYPEMRVHLQSLDGLSRERPLDVVVRPGPLDDSGMLVKPLFQIRIAVYASPLYLKNRIAPDSPGALREHSCIVTNCAGFADANDAAVWSLRRGTEVREVRVQSRVSVPDPAISHQLALTGVGVALLSQSAARWDVEEGRLVRLLPDWEPEPVELHAVYASRLTSSPKVRAFVQFLKQQFSGDPVHNLARILGTSSKQSQQPTAVLNRAS